MANTIRRNFTPVNRESDDPLTEAQRQDQERRIREDNEIFERTGVNPRPRPENNFLVPINGQEPSNIADDALDYLEGIDDDFITPSPDRLREAARTDEQRAFEQRENVIKERDIQKKTEDFNKRPKNTILDIEL